MSSPELHIKDSYYFELPKLLWQSARKTKADFPSVWIKNDAQFQAWEAERLGERLSEMNAQSNFGLPDVKQLVADYESWKHHDHANFGKSLRVYLDEQREALHGKYKAWAKENAKDAKRVTFEVWIKDAARDSEPGVWFARRMEDPAWAAQWSKTCLWASDVQAFASSTEPGTQWAPAKIEAYNYHLHGKILIPQPFGELRNFYQAESGLCISKFMVIQLVVAGLMIAAFAWLARRVATGGTPRGTLWNLLETLLVFVRDEVARKAIHGAHDHDEHGAGEHDTNGHAPAGSAHGELALAAHAHAESSHHSHAHDVHGHDSHGHAAHDDNPHAEADKFVPILWTIFMFILGCNLMGMLPWLGAPTGSWATTVAMALVTFSIGFVAGVWRFGFFGYWANQVPKMGLPIYIAVFLVPMIFAIEVLGLIIKHAVLSVRLLANMAAGHLVLLSILALAFSLEGARSDWWNTTAFLAIVGSAALSLLELFVAFLQAYVFTFLSALFINAAINQH